MLYITTRDASDAHTANKTLTADCAADGGLYLPRRMPQFAQEEIADLRSMSFNETVAWILNQFFSVQLSGWDVDFSIGRNPVKLASIGRKILVAQAWHNLDSRYAYVERNIFQKLCKGTDVSSIPTQWLKIAVRIAILFGIYGELLRGGQLHLNQMPDIAVDSSDFNAVMSVWYARQMGLPVGRIICSCDESGAFWDLVHLGEVNTGAISESLRCGLERLLHAAYGASEATRFLEICGKRGTYRIAEEPDLHLADHLFCAVVGRSRVPAVINSVYRTDAYLLDTGAAAPYGAVQDYRSKTGSNNPTLLISENNPILEADAITKATGLSQDAFYKLCKKT